MNDDDPGRGSGKVGRPPTPDTDRLPQESGNPAVGFRGPELDGSPRFSTESTRDAVGELTWNDLEVEIITLVSRLSNATFDLLVLIGELDARGSWRLRGALSCAAWLAFTCDIELVTAHNQVRVARALREYPALRAAMATGDVSYSKARMLCAHLSTEHAAELVELASTTPTSRLRTAIAAWSHGKETDEEIERRHRRDRFMSWRTDPDGMVRITARLAPEDAAAVCAVIDKSLTTDPIPAGAEDHPSLGQQRADALVRVVGSGAVGGTAVRSEVVIHVRDDGNTLRDGTPLTDHTVTRLLPESFVSLLVHDARRQPIDASPRRRFPTRRQRRVLDEIHPECAHPGCTATQFLQYDHIIAHDDGGPTTLDNLQRLCGPHNRAKEELRRTPQKNTDIQARRSATKPSGLPDEAA